MADPTDEKIELLVRSVLAAVDARLVEVRSEIQAVAAETEQRNRDVIARLQELELRLDTRATALGSTPPYGDLVGARMEQATQVLLERIEAMHQRNTLATNERFAQIDNALGQLSSSSLIPESPAPAPAAEAAAAIAPPAVITPSLDAMSAPLRVGPPTGQVPVAASPTSAITLPPIPALTSAPPREPSGEPTAPIDMSRLAEMLSEPLGTLSLPIQQ